MRRLISSDHAIAARDRPSPARTTPAVADAVGGAVVVAGLATTWVRHGNGSTLRGLDLADQLMRGALVPGWGVAAGAAIYAVVGLGAIVLATAPWRLPVLCWLRLVAATSVLLCCLALGATGRLPFGNWGTAMLLVASGASVVLATNVIDVRRRTTPTSANDQNRRWKGRDA